MNRHLTEDQVSRALAGQSTFDEQQHAHTCFECRSEIVRSQQLLALLRQGIHQYAERELPHSTPAIRRAPAVRHLPSAVAVAAGVAMIGAALFWPSRSETELSSSTRRDHPRTAAIGHAGTIDVVDPANAFYALQYGTLPMTNGHIVRIEVPRSAPVAFGLNPVDFVNARQGAILADVIVGEDGLARAVRFVRPATDVIQKE